MEARCYWFGCFADRSRVLRFASPGRCVGHFANIPNFLTGHEQGFLSLQQAYVLLSLGTA